MAVNPFLACTPATSWYAFPYTLSWSNNCEVAEVLSDIPFIAVGILTFGVSTLLLVMKRVSPSTVWLFSSAFLAFVAALQDLGQTLANGFAVNTIVVANESPIRAREILLALSIGFRFLFYWSYAAESPRKDLSTASTQKVTGINSLRVERTQVPHSGSWTRWGPPGTLLGTGLLTVIVIITALQVVWRVDHQFHQYSAFYATDTVLELLVSVILLLKLLSNTITPNSPNNMPVHTFSECLGPASGLFVNITVGVGNLLSFAFTESTVGRLLQAIEIYIIVISVMVIALLRHRDILLSPALPRGENRKDGMFILPEPVRGSTFRITPPVIETPHMSMILGATTQGRMPSRDALRRSVRRSLNHISSWVSARISRQRSPYEDEEVGLWNTEKLKGGPSHTENTDAVQQASTESVTQRPETWSEPARSSPGVSSASSTRSTTARPIEGSTRNDQILDPSRVVASHDTAPRQVPASSCPISTIPSSSKCEGSVTTPLESSPIYGLGGVQSVASPSNSRTSLGELLRQQNQLDESIQALKLFSKRTSTNSSSCSNSVPSPRSVLDLSRSPSIGQRTVCSEVSLSNFPVPPWLTTSIPTLPPSFSPTVKRVRGGTHLTSGPPIPTEDTHDPVYRKTSASLDIPGSPYFNSIPHSPLGEENESLSVEVEKPSRLHFERTQYNVTSFIGGLATPGEPGRGSHETPRWSAERESVVDITKTGLDVRKFPPPELPAPPSVAKLSTLPQHSRSSHADIVGEPAAITQSPRNEQTSRTPPTHITGSSVAAAREEADRIQRTFVRPRPPPLALQSHAVQNFGTRVQLVVDGFSST